MKTNQGFSLLELLVTMLIICIVALIGIPSFQGAIRNSRLTTSINELVTSINLARSEAIKRNHSVTLRKTATNWEDGWNIFVDTDNNGTLDGAGDAAACTAGNDCLLKIQEALPVGYTLRPNATQFTNFIRYLPNGMSSAGNGSFILCDTSSSTIPLAGTSRVLILNSIGRPRIGIDANGNGIPEVASGTDISSCN